MARPVKMIDEKLLEELCHIQCTMSEMASIFDVSIDTLANRYSDSIKKWQEGGKSSLRRMQWKKAMEGNVPMLIWLGKHLLGQKDSVELTTNQPEVKKLLEYWETAKIDARTSFEKRRDWGKAKQEESASS